MQLNMTINQRLTTELRMAPHIIQSIEVLTLPVLEMQAFIQEQLENNPALEQIDNDDERSIRVDENNGDDQEYNPEQQYSDEVSSHEKNEYLDDAIHDYSSLEQEEWSDIYSQDKISKRNDSDKDKKMEAIQNSADKPINLQDYLFEQFLLFDISDEIRDIGEQIIYNIDANGYFRDSLEEVIAGMDVVPDIKLAEEALQYVQKLEPLGVGARNIQECLILQLSPENPDYPFLKQLIQNHLEDIYYNRFPKISKETSKTIEEIHEAIEYIRHLNPKPGAEFDSAPIHCIVPDVIVENIDGEYVIHTMDENIPKLRVNPRLQRLLQLNENKIKQEEKLKVSQEDFIINTDDKEEIKNSKTQEYLKKKIEAAQWVIDAINQRQNTLKRVSEKIIEFQKDFLIQGVNALRPLRMQEVADPLDIHVSTVSRAIADKYIQTPRGIFPIKFFFTGKVENENGEIESRNSVQQRIQEMIDKEDKKKPLSDENIVELLKEQGLDIARRTVTKYRKELNIPSSRQRKIFL
ncbi:MAG TPA: RNA polymerase factor sigma-54 [Planctomycetota bacterium]|nr:RNA polymerase factor sigma-54 [Planctomycetota bacterium]